MKSQFILTSLMGGLVVLSSCKKEDPIIPNEEELITTLTYTLISQDLADTIVFSFQDLDGSGGNPPIKSGGPLKSNTSYSGTVQLLNEQSLPPEDITLEVLNEAEEHQFFYVHDLDLKADVSYNDQDANGNPLGVSTTFKTGDTSFGILSILLRHEPDKSAAGVKDGDPANAGGETDIEVLFNVVIQ